MVLRAKMIKEQEAIHQQHCMGFKTVRMTRNLDQKKN